MRKSLSYKILAAVMALSAVNVFVPHNMLAYDITSDNTTISNETFNENIYGNGYSFTINGGTINGNVFGAGNDDENYSEDASGGNVTLNNKSSASFVFGGYSNTGNVSGNHVTFNNSSAYTVCSARSDNGTVSDNHVTLNNSSASFVYGGYSIYRDVNENHVTINGGTFEGGTTLSSIGIFGAFSSKGTDIKLNDNNVTISNAIIKTNVYGGYYSGNSSAEIKNNTITIKENTDISETKLYGYKAYNTVSNITAENNALIIDGWSGNNGNSDYTVNSLNNFDIIEFKNINGNTGLTSDSVNGMDDTQLILSSIDVTNLGNVKNYTFGTITLNKTITDAINDFSNKIDTTNLNGWNFNDNETSGIYAGYIANATAEYDNNTITITGDIEKSVLTGKFIDESGKEHYKGSSTPDDTTDDATTLTIDNNFKTNAATIAGVYAAGTQNATDGVIYISGDNISYDGIVYAGYSENGSANSNTINVAADTIASKMTLSGTYNTDSGNILNLEGSAAFNAINNFDAINFNNLNISKDTVLTVNSTDATDKTAIKINSVASGTLNFTAGNYEKGTTTTLSSVSWSQALGNNVTIADDLFDNVQLDNYYFADNGSNGIFVNKVSLNADDSNKTDNKVDFNIKVDKSILTGKFIDENGNTQCNSNQTPDTASLTIGDGFTTNVSTVAGVYAADSNNATDGKLIISGNTTYGKNLYGAYAENGNAENSTVEISGNTNYNGTVYAGYSESGAVNNNTITVASGTKAEKMSLSGSNKTTAAGTLSINGNGSELNNISNFETINFNKVALNEAAAINVQEANLTGTTTINVNSFADGQIYHGGESVTLLKSAKAITGAGNVTIANDIVTAGLIQDLHISTAQSADNTSIDLYVKDVSMNDQINLVAENRAVAAAFVNQGTDLISDSLDTISRDSNYGVKTFAAVHGNRSKYDVNSDIKINGWSVIAGVGNADKFDNGSEFSWGVFYENGSGNYRTYNEFNNEFFRGDGSLVYNGGGIAARYTNKNGVYTEGSLRAGMLKSDMDNALRDGAGNFYGYESESAYYGAHIGIGKIISLSESSDLDVYGKFFHTYTEGYSFKVANDEFEFDSINSDRLRIGARITSNKENKFSTYYGLAYEYEFNGDADMQAQGLKAPTQSLQGSSVMAEVGFNYQPTPTSPWSFDLNMRGYTGERQGGSFNVQATYTF